LSYTRIGRAMVTRDSCGWNCHGSEALPIAVEQRQHNGS
jgi:hypothetical protein